MTKEPRTARREAIFEAAYKLLLEKGYKGTSMLAVAKAAKASNETLYNWFGDKQGLLGEMILANAQDTNGKLSKLLDGDPALTIDGFSDQLAEFGSALLQLRTGEKSIALNRAAAADVATGNLLGMLLAKNERDIVVLHLEQLFGEAQKNGHLRDDDTREITEVYLALLLGDIQIRRVIGVMAKPEPEKTRIHAERVGELLLQLFGKN